VPTITELVAAFDVKAFNCTDLLKSYLAGGNRISNSAGKPTEIATIEIFDKAHGLCFFIRITSVFSYLRSNQNKHTAPI